MTIARTIALALLMLTGCGPAMRQHVPLMQQTTQALGLTAPCVKHTPWGRYAEKVALGMPGETVQLEVVFRNADSCACPRTCFTLSWGYHPPHDGSFMARVSDTKLRRLDGSAHPPYVCLVPGEEATAVLQFTLDAMQDGPGFVTPSIFMARVPRGPVDDFKVDLFDCEGPATCVLYPYATCRSFSYPTQPPS